MVKALIFFIFVVQGVISNASSEPCNMKNLDPSQAEQLSSFFKKYQHNLSSYENWSNPANIPETTIFQIKQSLCKIISVALGSSCSPSDITIGMLKSQNGGALSIQLNNPDRGFLVLAPEVDYILSMLPQKMDAADLKNCQAASANNGQACVPKWVFGSFVDANDKSFRALIAGVADHGSYTGCVADSIKGLSSSKTNYQVLRCGFCSTNIDFSDTSYQLGVPVGNKPMELTAVKKGKAINYLPYGYQPVQTQKSDPSVKSAK